MPRALVVMICLVSACSKPSDESATKQWQAPAPPPELIVPNDVSIALEVDGSAQAPITSAMLLSAKPDFADADHRAWLISSLVPAASTIGTTVEASSPTGVSLKLSHPMTDGFEPVVYLTRRSEIIVAALDPKQPFPAYHGQGGRLHRAGDARPHIGPVAKIVITRPVTH